MKLNFKKKNESLLNENNSNEVSVLKDFLNKLDEVYKNSVGTEDYGECTEFFDEDGCVLMVMRVVSKNKIEFHFDGENGNDSFVYETEDNME